jgi:hypothetical protein
MTPEFGSPLRNEAILLGCNPIWHNGTLGWRWHCGCKDNRHGLDSQSSIITASSLSRVPAVPVPVSFTHHDELFMRAVGLGCTPYWSGYLWKCVCPGAVHGISSTYAALSTASLERAKAQI